MCTVLACLLLNDRGENGRRVSAGPRQRGEKGSHKTLVSFQRLSSSQHPPPSPVTGAAARVVLGGEHRGQRPAGRVVLLLQDAVQRAAEAGQGAPEPPAPCEAPAAAPAVEGRPAPGWRAWVRLGRIWPAPFLIAGGHAKLTLNAATQTEQRGGSPKNLLPG